MSLVRIKRKDLVVLDNTLAELANMQGSVRFAYAVAKTKININPEIVTIKEVIKLPDDFVAYENQRIDLCNQLADKDSSGKPLLFGGSFVIEANRTEFDERLKVLRDKYAEAISNRAKKEPEIEKFLEEEVEAVVSKIDLSDLPNIMTPNIIHRIMPIICECSDVSEPKKESLH
jgi:hypothetical protein